LIKYSTDIGGIQANGIIDNVKIYSVAIGTTEVDFDADNESLYVDPTPAIDNLFYDLKQELKRHNHNGFRRLYFKRRNPIYESTWQRIPDKYIQEFGSIEYSLDDTKVNFFKISDTEIKLRNDDGYFNDINDIKSFFFQSVSRYKALVKIEAGYIDSRGVEIPTDSTAFIGLVGDELPIDAENNIELNVISLINIFEEIPAEDVVGLGTAGMRSDEIISKIRDHTDGSSNVIFRQFISATNWNIQTGTNTYNLATSTNLSNMSCMDVIKKLAEAEGFVFYISPNGHFNFVDRSVNSITVSQYCDGVNPAVDVTETFCFVGLGKRDTEWGMTIKEKIEVGDAISKVYNKVVIQYDTATTSVVTKKESWTWGDSSSSYKFGVRPLEIKNEWMGVTQATIAADILYNEFRDAKREVAMDTKYIPHVELLDQCLVKYTTPKIIPKNASLWGGFLWGADDWTLGGGGNIDIDYVAFKIININHNLDDFSSSFKLRDI